MFVALAREAGIQARVQEVGQVVSWYQDQAQGLVYSVGHVNAGVGFADRFATVDLDRNVLYDRRGPLPISQARALAHFYNNRGAERMASGDLTGARAFFNTALAQDAGFAATWNNLGVLENRTGNTAAARRALETALRLDGRQDAALTNASALYRKLGMNVQAQALEQRLQSVQREDPFAQYMLGAEAERAGQLDQAIRHYRQAVRCTTPRISSTSGWRGPTSWPANSSAPIVSCCARRNWAGRRSRHATRPSWTAWPAGARSSRPGAEGRSGLLEETGLQDQALDLVRVAFDVLGIVLDQADVADHGALLERNRGALHLQVLITVTVSPACRVLPLLSRTTRVEPALSSAVHSKPQSAQIHSAPSA